MRPLVLITLIACGPTPTPKPPEKPTMPTLKTQPQPPTTDCQRALLALADGKLDGWHGADGCTRADADRVFGSFGKPDEPGLFGKAQDYPARAGAPYGLEIDCSDHGEIVAILVNAPKLGAPLEQVPGPPERVLRSGLGADVEQRVWATRGLVAHVQQPGEIVTLIAFRTMTIDEYVNGVWPTILQSAEVPR